MRVTKEQYAALMAKRPRPNKFNAKKKVVDGVQFDSTKEANRYQQLKFMEDQKIISDLVRQVPYPIYIKGAKICEYRCDFVYVKDGVRVREDVKGYKTDVYRLKKKMVEAEYGFKILET